MIEATLVHALITSQVRRMRPRSEMFCAGHLGGETSAPCGGRRGIRKGWRAPMACEIAGKGREEMRCESERERKGGSVCMRCCKSGNGREGAGYGNGVHAS